jgi:hypothetical protein
LYVGTPTKVIHNKPAKDYQDKVTYWK